MICYWFDQIIFHAEYLQENEVSQFVVAHILYLSIYLE